MVCEGCSSLSELCLGIPWAAEPSSSLSSFPFISTLLSETPFLCITSSWWGEKRNPVECALCSLAHRFHACVHSFTHSLIHIAGRVLFQIQEHHGQHSLLRDAGPEMRFFFVLVFVFFFYCAGSLSWLVGFLSFGTQAPECSGLVGVVLGLTAPQHVGP